MQEGVRVGSVGLLVQFHRRRLHTWPKRRLQGVRLSGSLLAFLNSSGFAPWSSSLPERTSSRQRTPSMPDMTQVGSVCAESHATAAGALPELDYMVSEPSTSCCGEQERTANVRLHKVLHQHVPHCKQHFSWDCGLACVLMVMKATASHACDYQTLRQMCPTTSIWTVDLAHLLRRFGLDVCFFTVTLGPNPAYANEGFYMANMQEDERRVSQLFLEAPSAGIALQQRALTSHELQEAMLTGECLVIALVDKRKLDPFTDTCMGLPTLCGIDAGYTGHYILIVGFDSAQQQFIVRDPAAVVSELRVSASALDLARRSFGTDEDLIIIPCVSAKEKQADSGVASEAAGRPGALADSLLASLKAIPDTSPSRL